MKKFILSAFFIGLLASSASAQVLYKISGKDLKKPSYIIGTHHLANVGFIDSINGVNDALAATEQVCVEIAAEQMMQPENMQTVMNASTMKEGQTLTSLLSADELTRLNALLKELMGVDFSNPQVAAQMNMLKPSMLLNQLSIMLYMSKHPNDYDPNSQFDNYFQIKAKENNEPVLSLETLEFQMNLLFNGTSIERQKESLMCLVDNRAFSEMMMEEMTKAYYAQNLNGLKEAMDLKMGTNCDGTPEEMKALIDDRNADWLTKMPKIMTDKPTFFAVGAGHLPGDKGVLNLLKAAGYTIEGIK